MMAKNNAKLWLLDNIELFDELSPDQKIVLQNSIVKYKYNKKDVIFQSGDRMDRVYFVVQGRVKIVKISETQKEGIKKIIRTGDFYGELAAIDPENYTHFSDSAIVMKNETVVLAIPTTVFKQVLESQPAVYQKVINKVLSNYKKLNNRLDSVMLKDSRRRVIDFMKEMAEEVGRPIGYEILIKHKLTHQEIASITGISRQKVTTILNEFKQQGLIHLERNSILVHDKKLFE